MAWIAIGLWNADPRRIVLVGSVLTYWVLEAASVAADQWWGHHVDPSSTIVSTSAALLFVVVGLVTLWPLVTVLDAVRSIPASDDTPRAAEPQRAGG